MSQAVGRDDRLREDIREFVRVFTGDDVEISVPYEPDAPAAAVTTITERQDGRPSIELVFNLAAAPLNHRPMRFGDAPGTDEWRRTVYEESMHYHQFDDALTTMDEEPDWDLLEVWHEGQARYHLGEDAPEANLYEEFIETDKGLEQIHDSYLIATVDTDENRDFVIEQRSEYADTDAIYEGIREEYDDPDIDIIEAPDTAMAQQYGDHLGRVDDRITDGIERAIDAGFQPPPEGYHAMS